MAAYELTDRYRLDAGRVFLSGSQALARLPYEQLRADRSAGLRTAAFISGYPGSPLGNYDRDVTAAAALAAADGLEMVFTPGMNEEIAATSVMGSQLAVTLPGCRHEGVIGIWYGKAPGLDRASDALRHATFAGTSSKGGALALVGDDPSAKSSTLPFSSGATLVDLNMPIVYPGDVQEAIDLGRHAIAMSRASGLWVSIKVVDGVADGTGTVELAPDRIRPVVPTVDVDGQVWVPVPSGRLLTPYTLDIEREFHEVRLPLAVRYATENGLNRVAVRGANDWIGVVATGHAWFQAREALRLLGLRTDDDLRAAGIRMLKIAVPAPLDPALVRTFAEGLAEVVVIEEKAPNLEWQVKDALYGRTGAPVVVGKRDEHEATLFPFAGTIDADAIAARLRPRLAVRLADRLAPEPPAPRRLIPLSLARTPYFCSGCPHNTSTQVPDGALVAGGIGCHSMVLMMEPDRVGDIVGLTSMGNEGAQWFGMAPFVEDDHIIQNLGDGTLFHSGMTTIRAAIASGTNITYKILYNGAVAMTGGQDPFGQLDVLALTRVLLAEGVTKVLITTDDLGKYRLGELPTGVRVWGRGRVLEAQEVLRLEPGVTILIHDQRCAAEQRRDRKRGRLDHRPFHVVINERVCEGCGDCGDVSNCLSVQPVDTPFGRKTRIDLATCNEDLTCLAGDCPSFMKVPRREAEPRQLPEAPSVLPAPTTPARPDGAIDGEWTVRLSGIGGTGVVTASQVIGTAAMLQGLHVRGMDQTGLSQKAGPVVSDLRLSMTEPAPSNRATASSIDVVLAFDRLVAGADTTTRAMDARRTVVVANAAVVPTGAMVVHPDRPFPSGEVDDRIAAVSAERIDVDASDLTRALLGDDSTVNIFMVGVAVQLGHLPVDPELVEQAIELNGVAVRRNIDSFRWGRAWACEPEHVQFTADPTVHEPEAPLVDRLAADLAEYQDRAYAERFRATMEPVEALGHDALTEAVARNLHKLMAYKDEYEVARLLLADAPKGARFLLHPPFLRSLGMREKIELGGWVKPLLGVLRTMRRLRGGALDVFGLARVRRLEREMIPEYEAAVDTLLRHLDDTNLDEAIAIASLPDRVRGYERLKLERADAYRTELQARLVAFAG